VSQQCVVRYPQDLPELPAIPGGMLAILVPSDSENGRLVEREPVLHSIPKS